MEKTIVVPQYTIPASSKVCLNRSQGAVQGDDHDQALVTIRKYATLPELLEQEHIDLEQLGVDGEKEEQWHWTYYEPAAIANGGHLRP